MAFKPKRKADLSQLFKHRPPTAGILYFKKEKCTSNLQPLSLHTPTAPQHTFHHASDCQGDHGSDGQIKIANAAAAGALHATRLPVWVGLVACCGSAARLGRRALIAALGRLAAGLSARGLLLFGIHVGNVPLLHGVGQLHARRPQAPQPSADRGGNRTLLQQGHHIGCLPGLAIAMATARRGLCGCCLRVGGLRYVGGRIGAAGVLLFFGIHLTTPKKDFCKHSVDTDRPDHTEKRRQLSTVHPTIACVSFFCFMQ